MEKQKNILVVDDDKSILRILTRILQKQGYNTRTAETGREAEEEINNQPYDLALIDVKLPDTDGVDLLQKMQATRPNMIKIILTGFASMDNGIKALNAGADAYLVKPVEPTELLKILKEKFEEHDKITSKS
jgi:DNA-binding response OmpR family regulator